MTQHSSSRRRLDIAVVVVILIVAGSLMYAFLPNVTRPGQTVVPPLPSSASDPTQSFLALFIVATAVGAPVTAAIVLAFLFYKASQHVPAETPPASASKVDKAATKPSNVATELSAREALFWKIVAALLILGAMAVAGLTIWPWLTQLFS